MHVTYHCVLNSKTIKAQKKMHACHLNAFGLKTTSSKIAELSVAWC